jgi:hypothetical protein
MKKTYWTETVPTAYIAVNKSRLKLYDKDGEMPTFYLSKQTEFQIEIFNPTSDVILAKIHLNGKAISQGGLVLNPGQRVFLDRYFDVAKKFLFDTYEVENTNGVKKAIENNGDLKVEFYKERIETLPLITTPDWTYRPYIYYNNTNNLGNYNIGTDPKYLRSTTYGTASIKTLGLFDTPSVSSSFQDTTSNTFKYDATIDSSLNFDDLDNVKNQPRSKKSKSIETGRVEKGSNSNQEFKTVNKSFEYIPFHVIEYKLLPISQKINTLEDVNIKRYCTNCGHKLGKTDKFCGQCGTKA